MNPPVLTVQGLAVHYGGIVAVSGFDLVMNEGERVALIGANGAGKSSVLNALAGVVPTTAGTIAYVGQALTALPAWQRVRQGLVLVPEGRGIFNRLSVEENLLMGAYGQPASAARPPLDPIFQRFPRLAQRRHQAAGTLSGGEQQLLALARASLARPLLLMLDEPSMGLAPLMVDQVFTLIRELAAQGVSLLLVEQNVRLALEICQRAVVLESGRTVLTDSAEACLNNPRVRAAYLGEAI